MALSQPQKAGVETRERQRESVRESNKQPDRQRERQKRKCSTPPSDKCYSYPSSNTHSDELPSFRPSVCVYVCDSSQF